MKTSQMESPEPYTASKNVADSTKFQPETKLSVARKTVQELALKIEESNSRSKLMRQQQQKTLKCQQQEHEVSLKHKEDYQYAQVVKEIKNITHELRKLKLDMTRVMKEKRQADNTFKASSSKQSTLWSAMERIRKEIQEIDEEHVLVELARIEAVKEQEIIEAQRKEEANRYQIQMETVKKKLKGVHQHDEVKQELETAKTELESIKSEGFSFMTSMDVIRNELKRVREEKSRLEKVEEKRDLTIETLNTKILKAKAKLESVTATTEKANSVASNLSLTVKQLRAETDTTKKEKQLIIDKIGKIKMEIPKTESEIELSEERLEAVMEELKTTKSTEVTALENLKNLIDSTIRARESTSISSSMITITSFEYEYLTGKAGSAEEIADKKVAAAHAWIEALKENEKEIRMKIKMGEKQMREVSVEVEYGAKVVASPRRSMYKIGSMTPGKRKLLSPATRQAFRSASFTKKREKVSRNLATLLDENDEMGE